MDSSCSLLDPRKGCNGFFPSEISKVSPSPQGQGWFRPLSIRALPDQTGVPCVREAGTAWKNQEQKGNCASSAYGATKGDRRMNMRREDQSTLCFRKELKQKPREDSVHLGSLRDVWLCPREKYRKLSSGRCRSTLSNN